MSGTKLSHGAKRRTACRVCGRTIRRSSGKLCADCLAVKRTLSGKQR